MFRSLRLCLHGQNAFIQLVVESEESFEQDRSDVAHSASPLQNSENWEEPIASRKKDSTVAEAVSGAVEHPKSMNEQNQRCLLRDGKDRIPSAITTNQCD